jgi:glycosyltransferase involved in cell wall biosynthesis
VPATDRYRHGIDAAMPRLFVDVTTSLMLAGEPPIGISRVEGEIARRLLRSSDLHPIPVVFRKDGLLLALAPEQVARIFLSRHVGSEEIRLRTPDISAAAAEAPAEPPPRQSPAPRSKLLRRVARACLARMPDAVREDVRIILIHARQIARTLFYGRRGSAVRPRRDSAPAHPTYIPAVRDEILPTLRIVVHPRPGDVLWTAGLYSNFVPLRTIGEMRARTGLRVVATSYDLIRVTHPHFNAPNMAAGLFAADAIALLDASDLVLAISEWTRRELLAFAARSGRAAPAVQLMALGCDIAARGTRIGLGAPSGLLQDLLRRRFALAIGTVERRKNYELLLRVWERLAADPSFTLDLVIVGRLGFGAEDSASAIERSPLFGSRILWLERCPDDALVRLYEACHLVLCPSFAEGWGLPITEALYLGRQVIASDRGAMIEACLGRGRLLDPEDDESWTAAIAEAAAAPRLEVALPDPPRWDAAAAGVEQQLRRLLAEREAA